MLQKYTSMRAKLLNTNIVTFERYFEMTMYSNQSFKIAIIRNI